ncbi:GNAT family N-acetyltransferase [Niallia circulans]|uniref:GNAT family N-acetyltransferase n=1 Tax=Niallia circulans TaxID=1397 RepID=A0A553SJ72_NIACI|nr:GNAT family N-acetyltransferase [Niallia circulans]TRZ37034.1 GNAT family N-acetyltransferase [Niallia circulans]
MEAKKITSMDELEQALHIRRKVFVEEQGVPLEDEYDEFDKLDGNCDHILVYYKGEPVGTGRVRSVEGLGKLERICILQDYRKFGLGKVIIAKLEELAADRKDKKVKLHGQTQAEGFYHKLGYETSSDVFMEDGIPHVLMTKSI